MTTLSQFNKDLSATIEWCSSRIDASRPKWCLRSDELRPDIEFDPPDDPSFFNRCEIIDSVVHQRRRLIPNPKTQSTDLNGGKLLLCFFDYTNHNQLTADETEWFFDWADNPPWDTWITTIGEALVSWVPRQFVDVVDHAIPMECMGMLLWAESPEENYPVDPNSYQNYPDWLPKLADQNNGV